jgi:uncharacterized membrane protein YdjX (TVP38/TMEM64 family)
MAEPGRVGAPEPSHGIHRTARFAPAWARAAGLAIVVAGVAMLASSDVTHRFLLQLVDVGERLILAHPTWGLVLFVVFAALSAVLAFFSSALLVPVAVETWGQPLSMLLLWSGWVVGGVCTYGIGRWLGRAVVVMLSSPEALVKFENRITARAPFSLVLLFQLALPSEVPGYVLGLARYSPPKFLLALGLAELPYVVGTVYLGESFLERRTLVFLAVAACVALFSAWAFRTLQKRLST